MNIKFIQILQIQPVNHWQWSSAIESSARRFYLELTKAGHFFALFYLNKPDMIVHQICLTLSIEIQ